MKVSDVDGVSDVACCMTCWCWRWKKKFTWRAQLIKAPKKNLSLLWASDKVRLFWLLLKNNNNKTVSLWLALIGVKLFVNLNLGCDVEVKDWQQQKYCNLQHKSCKMLKGAEVLPREQVKMDQYWSNFKISVKCHLGNLFKKVFSSKGTSSFTREKMFPFTNSNYLWSDASSQSSILWQLLEKVFKMLDFKIFLMFYGIIKPHNL